MSVSTYVHCYTCCFYYKYLSFFSIMLYNFLPELISEWEFNQSDTLTCLKLENILIIYLKVHLNSDWISMVYFVKLSKTALLIFVSHREQTLQKYIIMLTMMEQDNMGLWPINDRWSWRWPNLDILNIVLSYVGEPVNKFPGALSSAPLGS